MSQTRVSERPLSIVRRKHRRDLQFVGSRSCLPEADLAAIANFSDVPDLKSVRQNLPYVQVLDAHRECQEVGRSRRSKRRLSKAAFVETGHRERLTVARCPPITPEAKRALGPIT